MADLPDTPTLQGDAGNNGYDDAKPNKRSRNQLDDDDDDDGEGKGRERRKIDIKFINDKSRRHITFSKRKAGIMKKAYELSVLTGTQVLLLVVSETGLVYTFTTPKLQPLVTKPEGKNLIQACLNAPSPTGGADNGLDDSQGPPDNTLDDPQAHASVQGGMSRNGGMPQQPQGYAMPPQDPMGYQYGMGQPHQGGGNVPQYPIPPQARMPQHGQHQ